MSFIVIQKIVTQYKKDSEGKVIIDPISRKKKADGMKVVKETIRIDEVKSSRDYHNPKVYKENGVDGPVTVLYMVGDKSSDRRVPEIHIAESIESWNKRTGAIDIVN